MEPDGVPEYENVSVPPTMTFFTVIEPCLRFVKVQVTVSPASTLNVAWRFATEPLEFASSHATAVRSQPALSALGRDVLTGERRQRRSCRCSTAIVPFGVPVNPKLSVPPCITFFTITVPFFVFVKVQVTVSPAATLKVACRFATEPVESVSSRRQ